MKPIYIPIMLALCCFFGMRQGMADTITVQTDNYCCQPQALCTNDCRLSEGLPMTSWDNDAVSPKCYTNFKVITFNPGTSSSGSPRNVWYIVDSDNNPVYAYVDGEESVLRDNDWSYIMLVPGTLSQLKLCQRWHDSTVFYVSACGCNALLSLSYDYVDAWAPVTTTTTTTAVESTTTTIYETTTTIVTTSTTTSPSQFFPVSYTPGDKAVNVDWEDPGISVTFSDAVDGSTVNQNNFTVSYIDEYKKTVAGTYQTSGATVTFIPDTALPDYGKDIFVTISKGIKSKQGADLAWGISWQFTTLPKISFEIIPVQVVENEPLVKNKPTVVRIKPTWGRKKASGFYTTDVKKIIVDVDVAYQGGGTTASCSKKNVTIFAPEIESERKDSAPVQHYYAGFSEFKTRGRSINFYEGIVNGNRFTEVPIVHTTGSYTIIATITPVRQQKTPPRIFAESKDVAVVATRDNFRILYVPVAVGAWSGMAGREISIRDVVARNHNFIDLIYPLSHAICAVDPQAHRLHDNTIINVLGSIPIGFDKLYGILMLRNLSWIHYFGRRYDLIVGVAPDAWMSATYGADGVTHAETVPNAAFIKNSAGYPILAHEISHLMRYNGGGDKQGHDPETGFPPIYGYNVGTDQYIDSTVYTISEFMARSPAAIPLMWADVSGRANVWITNPNYECLLRAFSSGASPSYNIMQTGTKTLRASGIIALSGDRHTAVIDKVYVLDETDGDSAGMTGDYALELQDNAGAVLARHCFEPEFLSDNAGNHYTAFIEGIAWDDRCATVVLKYKESALCTVPRSLNKPQVTLSSPFAGQIANGTFDVAWDAADADGDTMTFTLLYSTDGGISWDMLEPRYDGQTYSLNTARIPNTNQCRIKIIAHDGFNSGEAVSDVFTVVNSPAVLVTDPAPKSENIAPSLKRVIIQFRDAMSSATITNETVYVQDAQGNRIAGEIFYDAEAKQAIFSFLERLHGLTRYTGVVTTDVTTVEGSRLKEPYTWWFVTKADTAPPEIASITPDDQASDVPLGQTISVVFANDMNAATLTQYTFTLRDADNFPVPGKVSYESSLKTATFAPIMDLRPHTEYIAMLSPLVCDTQGNRLGEYVSWSFVTSDKQGASTTTTTVPEGGSTTTTTAFFNEIKSLDGTLWQQTECTTCQFMGFYDKKLYYVTGIGGESGLLGHYMQIGNTFFSVTTLFPLEDFEMIHGAYVCNDGDCTMRFDYIVADSPVERYHQYYVLVRTDWEP
ncbi:MAG: Ig-like domain-containing protein [Desulfobacterota bacterium]|nr:Ig-like domain-containing protein [Thermodesulfobacteriota bacterium]